MKNITVELKLDGVVWTDVSADVRIQNGIRFSYGITGHRPTDRMARSGNIAFTLDNSIENSGGLQSYYTPGHTNVRTGFELNLPVRLSIASGSLYGSFPYGDGTLYGGSIYKFTGKIIKISVMPGATGTQEVTCSGMDFIWEMGKHKLNLLGVKESRRSDLLFGDIVGNMTESPEATSYSVGQQTFAFGLDDLKDEKTTALAAAQKTVMSEFGYGYIKGDELTGGVLVFEDRHHRVSTSPKWTLGESEVTLGMTDRSFELVYNQIKTISNPRAIGSSPEVLWTLQDIMEIGAGETKVITGRFTDPDQQSTRISGKDMISPAISTDYKFGSAGDGSSEDMNADLGVTETFGANSVELTLINNAGSTGFINLLRTRGTALRIFEPVEILSEDTASQTSYGKREFTLNLPYQDDPLVSKDFGDITLSRYKNPAFYISSVTVITDDSLSLSNRLGAALGAEPGDRITLTESVLGITAVDYFINSVNFEIMPGNIFRVTWSVSIASAEQSWLLGQVGFSELNDTTILGV